MVSFAFGSESASPPIQAPSVSKISALMPSRFIQSLCRVAARIAIMDAARGVKITPIIKTIKPHVWCLSRSKIRQRSSESSRD